ncbi:Phytochelatin synthase-domain-containing protein [Blastocladiella britannica]|nr:Phytochelatin synthase-domain-containing protein [Blastocladiella britannica]
MPWLRPAAALAPPLTHALRAAARGMASCASCGAADTLLCASHAHPLPVPIPPVPASFAAADLASRAESHVAAAVARTMDMRSEQAQLLQSTFYRRPLPSHLAPLTSSSGKRLFKESMALGYAENYFALAGTFTTQSEPAYCGLGSLAMILNALEIDPKKRWKGGWRWYSDEMLECCAPLDVIKNKGITFKEFSCMAKCNGLSVVAKRGDEVSLEEFVTDLTASVSNAFASDTHMVVSFSRRALGQTGDGHFSPVSVYHPSERKVLVLDTARFKYPSYFVDVELLHKSMQLVDTETGLPRGYFLLQRRADAIVETPPLAATGTAAPSPLLAESVTPTPPHLADTSADMAPAIPLCKVRNSDSRDPSWARVARVFCSHVPRAVRAVPELGRGLAPENNAATTAAVALLAERILGAIPPTFEVVFSEPGVDRTLPAAENAALSNAHADRLSSLVRQVASHPLYSVVLRAFARAAGTGGALPALSPLLGASGSGRMRRWAVPMPSRATLQGMSGPTADENRAAVAATILLLAVPRESYVRAVHGDVAHALERVRARSYLSGALKWEVERIQDQIQSLTHEYCECQNRSGAGICAIEGTACPAVPI